MSLLDKFLSNFSENKAAIEKWWEDLGTPRLTPDVIDRISNSVEEEAEQRSISDLEAERDTK